MNKSINIILKVAAAVLAMLLATSCIFEKEEIAGKKRDVMVLLDINTVGMVATRAAEDEAEAEGDEAEDTTEMPTPEEEALNTVRVYAYDSNDILIGYADNSAANDGVFHMVLRVPEGLETIDADFYVVANEASMQNGENPIALYQNSSKQDLMNLTFNALTGTALPMYGVEENVTLYLNKGVQHLNEIKGHKPGFQLNQDINITLTRSLAKIAVYAAEEGTSANNNVTINSITFKEIINSGYLFENANLPQTTGNVVLSETSVTVTKKLNRADEDFDAKRVNVNNFTQVAAPTYISENPAGKKLVINYTTGSGDKEAEIEMPEIERNTFYKVLCLVKANGEMTLELVVAEWEEEEQVIAFEDNVTLETGSRWTGDIIDTSDETGKSYKFKTANVDQIATFEFTLKTPVGGTWHAILDGDIQSFSFSDVTVYDEDGNSTSTSYTDRSSISGNITGTKISFSIKTLEDRAIGSPSKEVTVRMVAVSKYGRSLSVDGTEAKLTQVYNN